MADIEFNCKNCGGHLVVDARGAGKRVSCPFCQKNVLIPVRMETKVNISATLQPPPMVVAPATSAKSYLWIWITFIIFFVAIAMSVSIVLIKPMLFQKKLQNELSWLVEQQRDDGWWAFHWGMDKEQVQRILPRNPILMKNDNDRDGEFILGSVPKNGAGDEYYDVYFYFGKHTKGLERLQVCASQLLMPETPRPDYYKILYGILDAMLTNKYGKPLFGDGMLKGNKLGLLHGDCWEVNNACYIDLIESPQLTSIIISPSKGESGGSYLLTIAMNTSATDERQKEITVKEKRRAYKESPEYRIAPEENLDTPLLNELQQHGWGRFRWGMSREKLLSVVSPEISFAKHELYHDDFVSWKLSHPGIIINGVGCNVNVGLDCVTDTTRGLEIFYLTILQPANDCARIYDKLLEKLTACYGSEGISGTMQSGSGQVQCLSWTKGNTRVSLSKGLNISVLYEYIMQ